MKKIRQYDAVELSKIEMTRSYADIRKYLDKHGITMDTHYNLVVSILNFYDSARDVRTAYEHELQERGAKVPWAYSSWPHKSTVHRHLISHYDAPTIPKKYHSICENTVDVETKNGCVEKKIR